MTVGSRRKAREAALLTLYECEMSGTKVEEVAERAILDAELSAELADYARLLVRGVADQQEAIDAQLDGLLKKYDLMRLAAIDRNILRMAAYELGFVGYVPPRVVINEAIEVAKTFSTAESGKFINGVLGQYFKKAPRSQAAQEPVTIFDEEPPPVEETVMEEQTVAHDSKEAQEAIRIGAWKLRRDQ